MTAICTNLPIAEHNTNVCCQNKSEVLPETAKYHLNIYTLFMLYKLRVLCGLRGLNIFLAPKNKQAISVTNYLFQTTKKHPLRALRVLGNRSCVALLTGVLP